MTLHAGAADTKLFAACKQAPTSAICHDSGTTKIPVIDIIHTTATIVAVLTGVIAVVAIIISGFQLITSAGNAETVKNARRRLISAIIGVVVVALAWTIITFVTDKLLA
ncbi:pilin [Candidatus Saccharibacteria bacterium]|nr:pilin [Candidatus Saccharibacteria bacterium]